MTAHSNQSELVQLHTRLADARKRSRQIAKEIAHLKAQIEIRGGDPSGRHNTTERNALIYAAFRSNVPVADIAAQYQLSIHRVKELCKRIAARKSSGSGISHH